MRRTPRCTAYARSAPHSRSKRTWSSIARRPPANAAQCSIQNACLATKASRSASVTTARGSASSPGQAAKAERALYGERARSGGPSGSTCHHACPAASSQSTNRQACGPSRPPGSEVRCNCTPLDRVNFMEPTLGTEEIGKRGRDVPAPPKTQAPPPRIRIQLPRPAIEEGRWPIKRTAGDTIAVSADVFRDGHEVLRAVVRYRANGDRRLGEAPMVALDAHHNGVRWAGELTIDTVGPAQWTVQAWVDVFAGWRDEIARKLEAGQLDMSGETSEGIVILKEAAERATGANRSMLQATVAALESGEPVALALEAKLAAGIEGGARRPQ